MSGYVSYIERGVRYRSRHNINSLIISRRRLGNRVNCVTDTPTGGLMVLLYSICSHYYLLPIENEIIITDPAPS